MRYIANIEIGGFKKGEEVPKEKAEIWAKQYDKSPVDLVEDLPVKKKEVSSKMEERLKDIEKDLEDDGKLNYSHDPERKSPGRKKTIKKKNK